MRQSSALDSVLAWQAAVNAQDLDGLLEHSAPDIAVVGPRGTGVGHQVLREWLARAGLTEMGFSPPPAAGC
jgi:ketosteroid isomerase-like protein